MKYWKMMYFGVLVAGLSTIALMEVNAVITDHCLIGHDEAQMMCNRNASDNSGFDACLAKALKWIDVCYGTQPAHVGPWHWTYQEPTS